MDDVETYLYIQNLFTDKSAHYLQMYTGVKYTIQPGMCIIISH